MARTTTTPEARGVWSTSEHERFLEAIAMYPEGPWHLITAYIGTRSAKQVQTHAQKYQHKLLRHQRGLRKWKTKSKRPEHRVDKTTADRLTKGRIIVESAQPKARKLSMSSASEFSDDSDCSSFMSLKSMMDTIEPVPFECAELPETRDYMRPAPESDDRLLSEALDAVLAWLPSTESNYVCV